MKLNITVTRTADAQQDYLQIMSDDMVSVNVVLVAESIEVRDRRTGDERLLARTLAQPEVVTKKGKKAR